MALSYILSFSPKWYISDTFGRPAGGAKLFTFSNLNPTQFKPTFQDPGGNIPWTNPIIFDENGTQGPIYFEFDDANPNELYYIRVLDSDDNLLFDLNNYIPSSGTGGGSVTTSISLKNYIVNGQFWRNIGQSSTPVPTQLTIAPSANDGFTDPDIVFFKSNASATDTITFNKFILGDEPIPTDVTPEFYLNYQSTSGVGETFKYIQIPLCLHVNNLENQAITCTLWVQEGGIGGNDLQVAIAQFFGSNSGELTNPVVTNIGAAIIPVGTWAKVIVNGSIPSAGGKSLGTTGDDATYLRIYFQNDIAVNVNFTKPSLYIGNLAPASDFDTYDEIDTVISKPRTGDIRVSLNNFSPFGWVTMNDGTIGSASSGATARANIDTFQLYALIYQAVPDSLAPVSGGRTAPGTTFQNAVTDFALNKPMALTKQLGLALASVGIPGFGPTFGTSWNLGQYAGEELHTLTIPEIPSHNHPGSTAATSGVTGAGNFVVRSNSFFANVPAITVASQGGGLGHNTIQPTARYNIFVKL